MGCFNSTPVQQPRVRAPMRATQVHMVPTHGTYSRYFDQARAAFTEGDVNHDGVLDRNELFGVLMRLGFFNGVPPEMIQTIADSEMRKADSQQKDQHITFDGASKSYSSTPRAKVLIEQASARAAPPDALEPFLTFRCPRIPRAEFSPTLSSSCKISNAAGCSAPAAPNQFYGQPQYGAPPQYGAAQPPPQYGAPHGRRTAALRPASATTRRPAEHQDDKKRQRHADGGAAAGGAVAATAQRQRGETLGWAAALGPRERDVGRRRIGGGWHRIRRGSRGRRGHERGRSRRRLGARRDEHPRAAPSRAREEPWRTGRPAR